MTERPKAKRPVLRPNVVSIRFSNKGYSSIETLAQQYGLPQAVVIRVMCSVAMETPKALNARLHQVSEESGL